MVWVLRNKTSQQEEQQAELYPLLDHAAARLVKIEHGNWHFAEIFHLILGENFAPFSGQ